MRRFNKIKAPSYLKSNWKKWNIEWKHIYKDPTKKNIFRWKGYREDLILNYLGLSTQFHCSFCDIDDVTVGAAATIEHFKPKHKYFKYAYKYSNLYNCCGECQKKGKKYDPILLKPDIPNYKFQDYFEIDILTGKINPNPIASIENKQRANKTIKLYKLNNGDKPRLRLKALKLYLNNNGSVLKVSEIDKYSFRFFIEEYIRIHTP